MMKAKKAVLMVVVVVALVVAAVPVFGLRAGATVGATEAKVTTSPVSSLVGPAAPVVNKVGPGQAQRQQEVIQEVDPKVQAEGKISPDVLRALGIRQLPEGVDPIEYSRLAGERMEQRLKKGGSAADIVPQGSGQPLIMASNAAFSAAVATIQENITVPASQGILLGDWDGREDCVADREGEVIDTAFELTRTAVSEHTIANGFNENIFYYGDSVGNVYFVSSTNLTSVFPAPTAFPLNLPTALIANAGFSLSSDSRIVITGLAVNPVADLTSFFLASPFVYGPFSVFLGQVGEILYVTFTDTGSGVRLTGSGTLVRSGVLAIPVADITSLSLPGVISPPGFPVTVGTPLAIAFSVFSNLAGCCVDDDGNLYFQQVDLIQFTGANIVKVTDTGTNQDRSLAVNGIITLTTLNPTGGVYGTTSGPPSQVNRFTNYSGTSTFFGNIAAIACGPSNVVYAAVARSLNPADDQATRNTEGLFTNPAALGATPSMIITFTDCSGSFDSCSGVPQLGVAGVLPVADGFADPVPGSTVTWRTFVLGTGPDVRTSAAPTTAFFGSVTNTQKVDFQVDYTIYSGIMVDETNKVYVISGGTPAGVGTNPSPQLGEILCFEDNCPFDRRADFTDLRGTSFPNPPASGGNVGDGLDTRFDHIFWQSPLDKNVTPIGIASLSRGFLLYINRPRPGGPANLPNGTAQTDNGANGPLFFNQFDPSEQVAGGDRTSLAGLNGDDCGGGFEFLFGGTAFTISTTTTASISAASTPPFTISVASTSGFPTSGFLTIGGAEVVQYSGITSTSFNIVARGLNSTTAQSFLAGTTVQFGIFPSTNPAGACVSAVQLNFFWNANGSITFGGGDSSATPSVTAFRAGLPKIAAAWADLNPQSRASGFVGTFPVQALGFAGINAFKIRWINVPEKGFEGCGSRNNFSITLFDDGTGVDESCQIPNPTPEGPTDLRFTKEPNTGVIVGCPSRPDGTGFFVFDYGRMDLLGTPTRPVLVGYSIGGLAVTNPPGLCSTNLSAAALAADSDVFRPCLIGEGTEPTVFEFFNTGRDASVGSGGEISFAVPSFDLRFEGNNPAACTSVRQRDQNRQRVGFFGVTCLPPPNPQCLAIVPGPFVTTPTTTGLINVLCSVTLNFVGCGFRANESTIICQGFEDETGVPLQRPGKTVSTAITLSCDTTGGGAPTTIALTSVTPVSANLVRGTLSPLTGAGLPGTPFPLTCCGGTGTFTIVTTFTAGDNNRFGTFTRTTSCSTDLGVRAPVVISASPSSGDCGVPQDLVITGACFTIPQGPITSVFAVERGNPSNVVRATNFVVLNNNVIDALFSFGTVNAGKTFLIFVTGPGGTSRNLTALPTGAPAGCPIGNEQGVQVTFTCVKPPSPPPQPPPPTPPSVTGCEIQRTDAGGFLLVVTGDNIKQGATITIGGQQISKVKFKGETQPGSGVFTRLVLKGFCGALPGAIVIKNPDGGTSQPFSCNLRCPSD
jgi:hypothetical protein